MTNNIAFLKSILNAKNEDDFRLKSETTDRYGIVYRRYEQHYRGVRVEDLDYLVYERNGIIEVNESFRMPTHTKNSYFQFV